MTSGAPRVLEICAGGGGQAAGLEVAGFAHAALVELDASACATLRANRPTWTVVEGDVRTFDGRAHEGVDLLACGLPCPPFSSAGKQLGADDERDLFPTALRLVREARPRAVLIENVPGFTAPKFEAYRHAFLDQLRRAGYATAWRILRACDYGVPQLRPRFVLVALRDDVTAPFAWPTPVARHVTVGDALVGLMGAGGWRGAAAWQQRARAVAPTLVGGSRKHGGADLGPTWARAQWAGLGVDGAGLANAPPAADFPVDGSPRLTLAMAARLQGFAAAWRFEGGKTAVYRQIANAFPSPVAEAVGRALYNALTEDS